MTFILLFLLGVVAAVFGSLIGLGGGVIIVPGLLMLSPYLMDQPLNTAEAVGTSLMVLIFTGLASTFTGYRQKRIDFRSGWLFFITSGPGSMLGAVVTGRMNSDAFEILFGVFMLLMAVLIGIRKRIRPLRREWKYRRTYTDIEGRTCHYGYNLSSALVLGFFVGFVSGLFGIGGGSLFVPVMILLFQFPPHVATATSMFIILLSSALGTTTKIYLGEVDFASAAALAPGALAGGWFGSWLAGRLKSGVLTKVLIVSFVILALRMIISGIL